MNETLVPSGSAVLQKETVREQDKAMLVLSYLGLLALIPRLTIKDSDFVLWHARQGLALVAAWGAVFVASLILAFIPVVGMLFMMVAMLSGIGVLVLGILGIINALDGKRWPIPVISSLAEKL